MKSWTVFADAGYAPATSTAVYTCPSGQTAIVDKCTSFSTAGGTLTLSIVPASGTAGASNAIFTKTLAAGESYVWPEMVGQALKAGDAIYELAGAASTVTRRISGRAGT